MATLARCAIAPTGSMAYVGVRFPGCLLAMPNVGMAFLALENRMLQISASGQPMFQYAQDLYRLEWRNDELCYIGPGMLDEWRSVNEALNNHRTPDLFWVALSTAKNELLSEI